MKRKKRLNLKDYETPLEFIGNTMVNTAILCFFFYCGLSKFSYISIGGVVLSKFIVTFLFFAVAFFLTMFYIKGIEGNLNFMKEGMIALTTLEIFILIGRAEEHAMYLLVLAILCVVCVLVSIYLYYIKKKKAEQLGKRLNTHKVSKYIGRRVCDVLLSTLSIMAMVGIFFDEILPVARKLIVKNEVVIEKNSADSSDTDIYYENLWKYRDEVYKTLSMEEKVRLFEDIGAIECNYLGIDTVQLAIGDFDEEYKMGEYDHSKSLITLNEKMVINEPLQAIETYLHEIFHVYEYALVEKMDSLGIDEDEVNTNLKCFRDIYKWKNEFGNYSEGTEVNEYSDYFDQNCEYRAREYSEYWVEWYEYLIYENDNE